LTSGIESWFLYLRTPPVFGKQPLYCILQALTQTCIWQQPNIDLVIIHDYDWIAATFNDTEDIFTSYGTDYERLTTRILENCQLQVAQGKWICIFVLYVY
jgi:hypothetical protein